MTSRTGNRGVVYFGVLLVGASAVVAVMLFASSPTSSAASPAAQQFPVTATTAASDMPGMDHGPGGMATSSPSPTSSTVSPWATHDHSGTKSHDHGTPASSPSPTSSADSPWATQDHSDTKTHDHGTPAKAVDRPLAPVLGVFGGGASAVMLSAGLLRRRDRVRSQAKQAARDGCKAQK